MLVRIHCCLKAHPCTHTSHRPLADDLADADVRSETDGELTCWRAVAFHDLVHPAPAVKLVICTALHVSHGHLQSECLSRNPPSDHPGSPMRNCTYQSMGGMLADAKFLKASLYPYMRSTRCSIQQPAMTMCKPINDAGPPEMYWQQHALHPAGHITMDTPMQSYRPCLQHRAATASKTRLQEQGSP